MKLVTVVVFLLAACVGFCAPMSGGAKATATFESLDKHLSSGSPQLQEAAFWSTALLMLDRSNKESESLAMRCFGWNVWEQAPGFAAYRTYDEPSVAFVAAKPFSLASLYELQSYKVWAGGFYQTFGTEADAAKAREELKVRGGFVGEVQETLKPRMLSF